MERRREVYTALAYLAGDFLGKVQRRGDRAIGEAARAETTQHYTCRLNPR